MKKLIALVLALICILCLASCSHQSENLTTPDTTQPEESTIDSAIILNELSEVPSIAVNMNGKRQELFNSFVCAHEYSSGAVADGILILQSLENVIEHWVSEGMIPTIILDSQSELVNMESNIVLTDPITFHVYEEINGGYNKIASLENATITDVYNYGVDNLSGMNVYIRFDIFKTTDRGDATYAYIMNVNFKTE